MNKREFNKLIKKIESCDSLIELKTFCNCSRVGLYGYLDDYLTDDEAMQYILDTCREMIRLKYILLDVKDFNAEFYHLDNYSNLENTNETIEDLKKDVIAELENKLD